MPFLDPPEPLASHTRLPYRINAALVLVLGGAFGIGGFMFAAGLRWIDLPLGNGPRWMLAVFGATALLLGILLAARAAETLALRTRAAGAPPGWPTDYPWPRDRVLDDDRPRMLVFDALGLAAMLPLLLMLNLPALAEPQLLPVIAWLLLGLLDLLALGGLLSMARRWLGRGRGGRVVLAVERLPVAPGQTLRGALRWNGKAPVDLELRGVREWAERHLESRVIKTQCFFRERVPPPDQYGGIAIAVPADAPGTQLAAPPVVYWELVVRDGGREAGILLPIYPAARNIS